ncbi:MAG: hypothetical protein U1C72_01265 [Candidatus Pacearchaeota archaeon]|nr:hypothetical protein [Candidatus Pacearchaeota archaeon]
MRKKLWKGLHSTFKSDVEAFLHHAIDEHQPGWSSYPASPYDGSDGLMVITSEDVEPLYSNWVYVFAPRALTVFYSHQQNEPPRPGQASTPIYWKDFPGGISRRMPEVQHWYVLDMAGVFPLPGEEPNWAIVECGENLEHCGHLTYVHNAKVPRPDHAKGKDFRHEYLQVPYSVAVAHYNREQAA